MTEAAISQFNELRLLLEGSVPSPGIVIVTSAKKEDGTSYAGFGLADSLAASGHRTLLLRCAEDSVEPPASAFRTVSEERRSPRSIGDRGLLVADGSDYRFTPSTSRDGVEQALMTLRSEFAYVVVDGGVFPKRPLTGLLTTLCDATLIALCSGRNKSAADTVVANAIATTQMSVLGIVSTSRKSIAAFESLGLAEHLQKPRLLKVGSVAAGV